MARKKQRKFFPPEAKSIEIAKAIGGKIADILKDFVQGGKKQP